MPATLVRAERRNTPICIRKHIGVIYFELPEDNMRE